MPLCKTQRRTGGGGIRIHSSCEPRMRVVGLTRPPSYHRRKGSPWLIE